MAKSCSSLRTTRILEDFEDALNEEKGMRRRTRDVAKRGAVKLFMDEPELMNYIAVPYGECYPKPNKRARKCVFYQTINRDLDPPGW